MEQKEQEMSAALRILSYSDKITINDHDNTLENNQIATQAMTSFMKWLERESLAVGATRIDISTIEDFNEEDSKPMTQIHVHGVNSQNESVYEFEKRIFMESQKVSGLPVTLLLSAFRL